MFFKVRKDRKTKLVMNPSTSIIFPNFNLYFFSGILTTILIIPNNSI
jgi:hypothetical protein